MGKKRLRESYQRDAEHSPVLTMQLNPKVSRVSQVTCTPLPRP
jgi:hypothetical protein